jgi:hypothetical protein
VIPGAPVPFPFLFVVLDAAPPPGSGGGPAADQLRGRRAAAFARPGREFFFIFFRFLIYRNFSY